MRACLLAPMLAVLLAANGYAVWQIHLLRGEVAALRSEVGKQRIGGPAALLELAREAAEALGGGEMERAEDSLQRLGQMIEETQELVQEHRRAIAAQADRARQAVRRGSSRARAEIDTLVDMLSRGERGDASE